MPKLDSNMSTFAIATCVALGIGSLFGSFSVENSGRAVSFLASTPAMADETVPVARWASSATGRVEPKSGEVRVSSIVGGRVKEIAVGVNDVVKKGDVLVILDEGDALSRIEAARSELAVRKVERTEEPVEGLAKERDDAEDALGDAEREVFAAQRALDQTIVELYHGRVAATLVDAARERLKSAKDVVEKRAQELDIINDKEGMPLQTRLQSGVTIARAELAIAEKAFDRMHIRAPFDGTVLNVIARIGETVAPSPGNALVAFGDISTMRVRAEVEERDVAKVRVGQGVVVRSDAFPDQEFEGKVVSIASSLGSPRIATRGPRRPNDVDVLEVVADLDGAPPLLTGMRVDVFFKNDSAEAKKSAMETTATN